MCGVSKAQMSSSMPQNRRMETAVLLTAEAFAPYVDRWRRDSWEDNDPPMRLSDIVPPHITLLWPWHPNPSDPAALQRMHEVTAATAPFELRFRTVGVFDDDLVFLEPDASHALDGLFRGLVEAFPEFPPYGGRFDSVHLHLTVSTTGGEAVAADVRASGPDLQMLVEHISVWSPGDSGRWSERQRIPLGSST